MNVELTGAAKLRGEITPPPDKSISHRAAIFSSIARGRSVIRNYLRAGDTLTTLEALRALGAEVQEDGEIIIKGRGLYGLREPDSPVYCGNSGTTMRLLAGLLSGQPFFSVLSGDGYLNRRPMKRVLRPMSLMGANVMAREGDAFPPIAIRGGRLKPIRYELPVASAQVKSAVLLAGLYAGGTTEVVETVKSRDHTERMLPAYGARVEADGLVTRVTGGVELRGVEVNVPNDFSSAAFFIAAALMVGDSELIVRDVGVNPTRTGFLDAIGKMGARVEVLDVREVSGEPVADLRCRTSALGAVEIGEDMIPFLVDEFPVLCVLASQAEGVTVISGAEELRVKESDRISAMAEGLGKMGVEVEEFRDGLSIKGKAALRGADIRSHGDHRIAMAFSVAALAAEGRTVIQDAGAADISFPGFFETLKGAAR